MSQLLAKVPVHLSNTSAFLDHMRNAIFEIGSVIESFDVTSLDTNVQNDQELQAFSEMLDKHVSTINTFGLGKRRIKTLISECLKCDIFRWFENYYSQTRGLAMSQ